MPRYKWLLPLVLWLLLLPPGTVAAAPLNNTGHQIFLDDVLGNYICTWQMTQRHPELCPAFGPGARTARLKYLRAQLPDPLPEMAVKELEVPEGAVTVHTLAYVRGLPAMSYAHPAEAEVGLPPLRTFYDGDNWVSVMGRVDYNGETWYQINSGEFMRAANLSFASPSRFHGVILQEQPQYPFAWINRSVNASSLPGNTEPGTHFDRYQLVTIFAQAWIDGQLWYMLGPDQWVEQQNLSRVDVDPPPQGVKPGEKWIEVDTFEQTLAAYKGDRMIFATLISSGRPGTWTPSGLTRIWGKLPTTPMINRDVGPESPGWYYLEDVEWTQYFNGAYALHTAYWHDAFGFTRSHGCVNLTPLDAKWLFQWTTPYVPARTAVVYSTEGDMGTWVWVHRSDPSPDPAHSY